MIVFMMVKIAVFAPMPSASVATAITANPRFNRNCRTASLQSFHINSPNADRSPCASVDLQDFQAELRKVGVMSGNGKSQKRAGRANQARQNFDLPEKTFA